MFSPSYQVADIARHVTLEPGDVILTGTPAHSRPVQPGDVGAVEITGSAACEESRRAGRAAAGRGGRRHQPAVTAATLHVALATPEDEAERQVAAR